MGSMRVAVTTGPSERPNRVRMTAAATRRGARAGDSGAAMQWRRRRRWELGARGGDLVPRRAYDRVSRLSLAVVVVAAGRIICSSPRERDVPRILGALHDAASGRRATAPCGAGPAEPGHRTHGRGAAPAGRRRGEHARRHRGRRASSGGTAGQGPAAATMERHAASSPIQSAHPHRLQAAHDHPPMPG